VQVPDAFEFLWTPSRYKAVYGGRGSAKSHSIATALVTQAAAQPLRVLCCREIQNSIQDSVKQLLDDKIRACSLGSFFSSTKTEIVGKNGSRFMFAGLRTNADSIKSMEGLDRAWVEEASRVSQRSWNLLIPTVRKTGSEIWASWNPESEYDPVDMMFRGKHVPPGAIVRRVSYSDNPFFPDVLRQEMEFDRSSDPQKAAHVWDGDYQQAPKGAYYADLLAKALIEQRIGHVPADPIADVHVGFDLGNGPNMVMVFTQWIGREIRIVETLAGDEQAANEGWPWYIRQLRARPYIYGDIILPHDARIRQRGTGKGDEAALLEANFRTRVVDKMDPGERVKLVQRFLPMTWIDATNCADGLRSWKAYREDYDDKLRISRGPLHDWASHYADALGHVYQAYDEPVASKPKIRENRGHAQGWMG
jgi:phage terminase large subunit